MTATSQALVERFYHEVWDGADERAAHEILAPDLRFHGSLGLERDGPDGFIDYMRMVHTALGGYRCIIEDLITTDDRAAAKMLFRGVHRDTFLGFAATGEEVTWAGAAFFGMRSGRIAELWVLGDLDGLKQRLAATARQ